MAYMCYSTIEYIRVWAINRARIVLEGRHLNILKTACIALLVILVANMPAAYGSSWPMFQYDAQNTGFNADEQGIAPPLKVDWVKGGELALYETRTRPVIADGLVYVGERSGSRGKLLAISLLTGKCLWVIEGLIVENAPALANGRIYFGATDGKFYALDAKSGQTIWSVSAGPTTSPIIFGDRIYFGTQSGGVCVLNAATGEKLWSINRSGFRSAPAVTNDTLFIGGNEVIALDPSNGQIKWSFADQSRSFSAPAVRGKSVYVSSDYYLYCLDADSGRVKWSRYLGIRNGSSKIPVLAGNTVYLGAVTAVDADTGGVKWAFDGRNQYPIVSVAVANGYVFVGSTRTDTTLDSSNGRIYVLNADTGELVYQYFAGVCHNDWYAIDPSPSIAEGSVVLNMSTYMLFCLSPPDRSPLLGVSVDKNKINAYDNETGSVNLTFNLDATGTVTADVLDSQGTTVYRLAENQTLGKGAHSLVWHGLIYFQEMADPVLRDEFGDKCILVAPDGDYKLLITVKSATGKSYTGSATVKVEAQV